MNMYILAATRSPFCKMGSLLDSLSAADLGRHATSSLLTQTGINPETFSEIIFGCVGQPADSANIARVIALRSGIPQNIPGMTVHRNCASGLEAITTAHQRMCANRGDLFLVGGTESMSNYPLLYSKEAALHFTDFAKSKSISDKLTAATHFRPNHFSPLVSLKLGLTDPVCGLNMGETAEILSREFNISREEQDAFAVQSQSRAHAGKELLCEEIAPIQVNGEAITEDNGIRTDSTQKKLATLSPVFDKLTGTVTAANSSQISDGAVALAVSSEQQAQKLEIEPLGRIVDYSFTGCDPKRMGLGPVLAIADLLRRTKLTLDDIDLFEINEAFATQVLACLKAFKEHEYAKKAGLEQAIGEIPLSKLNQLGGSIALGHPVGATGSRLVFTALKQLKRNKQKRAIVSMCIGGGQGGAMMVETL